MFTGHVTRKFSAYLHDELPPDENRRVAEHLIACGHCRAEFDQVKLGAALAAKLRVVPAPDFLWTNIAAAGAGSSQRQVSSQRMRWITVSAVATAVIVLLVAGAWLRSSLRTAASQPAWNVARLEGRPRVGAKTIDGKGRLGVGQWLETDSGSRATIDIADIGQAEIDPNTRVRLIQTQPTEHRLELARGRLSARVWAPPKLFFVDTPSGIAEDLGCAYTLEVDDAGNSTLHVTLGWVSLQLTDREATVPSGAACLTRRGLGPGTPYFEDASEAFRSALATVDFGNEQSKDEALKTVISEARAQDAMTLWYLLARVQDAQRARVFDRLAQLAPPPAGVTREGVVSLDRQMLDLWKDKLGFAPGPNSPKLNLKKI